MQVLDKIAAYQATGINLSDSDFFEISWKSVILTYLVAPWVIDVPRPLFHVKRASIQGFRADFVVSRGSVA